MKVMVNIVYFSNNQKSFLNQLVEEYNKYPAHVDIFIHSNKKKLKDLNKSLYKNGSILIKKYNLFLRFFLFLNKGYYLTWAPRRFIKKNVNKYDIFIFTDDDILIPKAAFNYWVKEKDPLFEKKQIPGFVLLEVDDDGIEYALGYAKKKFVKKIKIGDSEFYINENHKYMACWMYDKTMMNYWINSGYYDIRKIINPKDLKSDFLDKLKINNLSLRYLFYDFRNKKGHGIRENSTYGMNSPNLKLIKNTLLLIDENKLSNDNKIYHLDNHYSKGDHPIGSTRLVDLF